MCVCVCVLPRRAQDPGAIPFNGVYYEPPMKGRPGEIHPDKSYTFQHPRPPK